MADINPNWARWIAVSLSMYFKTVAAAAGVKLIVHGIDECQSDDIKVDHAELKINGPFVRQLSNGYFRLDVDTNILLTDLMGGENDNPYNLLSWAGQFQQAAEKAIPVHRYGPDTVGIDDDSLLGCLSVKAGKKGSDIYQFGQVNIKDRVRQVAVDTQHWMFLSIN